VATTVNIIQGIKPGTFKITGYKGVGITGYAPVACVAIIYADWFLPSKDELNKMYVNLHKGTDENGIVYAPVGGFLATAYWSSSEMTGAYDSAHNAFFQNFTTGVQNGFGKEQTAATTRACRAFTSTTVYALRATGPAGGLIFYKLGNNYQEASPTDLSTNQRWSNIHDVAIGVTAEGTAIGTGQANTLAIIGQTGHTTSAAKLCDDLIITI
jgi:hypothetical protein